MSAQFKTMVAAGLLACAGALASAANAGEAGRVVFTTGQVRIAAHPAALNGTVQEGDELSTGADGYVYVKTVDAGFLVLRPNSKARITAYHVDAQNPSNTRVKLELLSGVARSISGRGVKQARQNFRFNTPVAAIGVRGTDFVVYTDQQTSRVAVMSGGVVMSGFGGACGPEGNGPCEGGASRELFAGQAGLMLQLQRGQISPQLLRSPSPSPVEQGAPARPDEPEGKAASATAPTADVNLDPQKSANVLDDKTKKTNAADKPPADGTVVPKPDVTVVPKDPVVTPPVVVPPAPTGPEVLWGRYQAIAGAPVNADALAEMKNGKYGAYDFLGPYQIARLKTSALVMPNEGTATFTLTEGEAQIQKAGQSPLSAAIQDARLSVDFAAKTYTTGLTVVNGDTSVPLNMSGVVYSSGKFGNPSELSGTKLVGYLGGAKADEAAYIFNVISGNVTASGATRWGR